MVKKIKQEAIDSYGAEAFTDLLPLQGIRTRPGMYVYNTGQAGFQQLFTEIFDNSVDEAMNGYNDEIIVRLNADGGITVKDFGRGMPVSNYQNTKTPTVEKIFTTPHMGGKFDTSNYNSAGGLHGVGSSVVLALSKYVDIKICRNGYLYNLKLRYHNPTKSEHYDYEVLEPLTKVKKIEDGITGTEVTFKPDEQVFGDLKFKDSLIREKIDYTCYLENYIKVTLIDDRNEDSATKLNEYGIEDGYEEVLVEDAETGESKKVKQLKPNITEIKYEGGIKQLVTDLNDGLVTKTPVIEIQGSTNNINYDIVMQWGNDFSEHTLSFVNNIRTVDGGYHETAMRSSLTRALQDYAKANNLNKMKRGKKSITVNLDGKDIREGMTSVINMKVPEVIPLDDEGYEYLAKSKEEQDAQKAMYLSHIATVSFEGQTKGKLSTVEVQSLIAPLIYDNLTNYFNQNPKVAQALIDKSIRAMEAREAAKKERNKVRNKKSDSVKLSDKLSKALGKDYAKNELFLVEGEVELP